MSGLTMHLHSDPASGMAASQAAALNNQALSLSRQGDYAAGENNLTTAITRNALGELYLKMGKIMDAEEQLKKAVSVRMRNGPAYDAAVSVENLGQVHEVKGDLEEVRRRPGKTFDQSQLLACSGCKSAFYCGRACQAKDWRARHKTFCKKRA